MDPAIDLPSPITRKESGMTNADRIIADMERICRRPLPERERLIIAAYNPCPNGVHVCGVSSEHSTDGYEYPVTLANVPSADPRTTWERGRHLALPPDEDHDLVVDLMIDASIEADYCIRRQDLSALLRALEDQRG
jgi:hypothetical protein